MTKTVAVRFEPPRDLSAALAGVLLDGKVGAREIGVMLVDLSVRGWFHVEEEADGRWGLRSAAHIPPAEDKLSPAEVALVDLLFRPGLSTLSGSSRAQYVSLLTIRHRLQGHIDEIGELLGQELIDHGLTTRNPAKRSLGRRVSLTTEGERVVDQIKGYRLYLQTAEAGPLEGADLAAYVRARLPFATALCVADSWVERLESVAPSQLGEIGDGLRRNPLIYGAGVSGSYSLESILPVNLAENYGARLLGGGR